MRQADQVILKTVHALERGLIPLSKGWTIRQTDETPDFSWFKFSEDSGTVNAYAILVGLLCKTALEKRHVTAREKAIEGSLKYAMRCFLLSLGFIGYEYKAARKILLSKLEGSTSRKHGMKGEVTSDE